MSESNASRMLRVSDVADRLGVSEKTVRRWFKAGTLPQPIKLGRLLLWKPADLSHLI
jgi:excisionase family DNA binding protein